MSIASRLLVLCGLVAGTLFSQDTRARVQGVVTDSSGAVVVRCLVTLTNSETGTQASQMTQQHRRLSVRSGSAGYLYRHGKTGRLPDFRSEERTRRRPAATSP